MRIAERVVVITGAAGGIGAALAHRFAAEGAAGIVLSDIDHGAVTALAGELPVDAVGVRTDVAVKDEVGALAATALDRYGRIDLFCSNAGITSGVGIDDEAAWQRSWAINVQAHVYAARAVLPRMLERGEGYLLQTCSAAGLLTAVGDAPYTVTKHAAVAFAEWLSITYGDRGIGVSALCPQGVDTPLLRDGLDAGHVGARVTAASGAVLSPDDVAEAVVAGLADERFLILPHPEVASYLAHKTRDPDRWLTGMRRLADGVAG
ncbi:SDR family oxidoreductase [Planosporangium sp. 12N6]|uniref:SDR family oxidoreductase n=1 Tax=Planosporangium spinosum TaxID=3402278 RepID=UPI003CEACE9C